jgi:hypothetical protein
MIFTFEKPNCVNTIVGVDHRALVPVWTQPELGYVVYVHKLPDGGYAGIPQALVG